MPNRARDGMKGDINIVARDSVSCRNAQSDTRWNESLIDVATQSFTLRLRCPIGREMERKLLVIDFSVRA